MPNRKVAPKIKKNFRGYNSFLCHRKDLVTLKREVLSYDVNAPLRMRNEEFYRFASVRPTLLKRFYSPYLIKENLCLEGNFNIIISR